MKIGCVWEHNDEDSMLFADQFPGAYTRGPSKALALQKMPAEIRAYQLWRGGPIPDALEVEIVQEKTSELTVSDADSDVLFDSERKGLSLPEYAELKALALKSARDFLTLFEAIPDKTKSCYPARETFYGPVPRTALEMYEHTKNVNEYYFKVTGVEPTPLHAGLFRRFSACRRCLAPARLPPPHGKSLEKLSAWSATQFSAS